MEESRSSSEMPIPLLSLNDFANRVDRSSFERSGFTFASADTDRLRSLADRISDHLRAGGGVFAKSDIALLTDAGETLVSRARATIGSPGIVEAARQEAQDMTRLGNDIHEVREYVRGLCPI